MSDSIIRIIGVGFSLIILHSLTIEKLQFVICMEKCSRINYLLNIKDHGYISWYKK